MTGPPTPSTGGWASSRPGSVRCCSGCGSPGTGTIPASAELGHPLGDAVAGMSVLPGTRARPFPSRGNDRYRASSATVPRAAAPRTAAIGRIAGQSATGRRRRMWTWHRRTPRLCASGTQEGMRVDIGIDLGTANTVVSSVRRGILFDEPTVMLLRRGGARRERVLAVGQEAADLLGRAPSSFVAVRPLHDGVVTDLETA